MRKKLKEVCDFYSGTGFPVKYQGENDGELPFYKVGDIANNATAGNVYLSLCNNFISHDVAKEIKGTIIPSDVVVFAKIGEALKLNRRAITACDCLIDNNAMGIGGKSEYLNSMYFYFYMKNLKMETLAESTTVPSVRKTKLEEIEIDVPTLAEQSEIVDILAKLQKVINERQEQLEKLDELIKARFVEFFGDTVINPKGWTEHRLDEYITFLTSGSRGWAQYFTDEKNELFITIKNVKNNHITLGDIQYVDAPENKEAERTKVKTGDLLISITADLGRTGVVDDSIADRGAYINQHLSLVRLDQDKIKPLYVSYFLETSGGKRQFESKNQKGVKAGLNFEAIKSLKILVPPIEMQKQYIDFVEQVDKSKVAVQKSLDETQRLFDSLMQEYFG